MKQTWKTRGKNQTSWCAKFKPTGKRWAPGTSSAAGSGLAAFRRVEPKADAAGSETFVMRMRGGPGAPPWRGTACCQLYYRPRALRRQPICPFRAEVRQAQFLFLDPQQRMRTCKLRRGRRHGGDKGIAIDCHGKVIDRACTARIPHRLIGFKAGIDHCGAHRPAT
jgi:hypothetical protein